MIDPREIRSQCARDVARARSSAGPTPWLVAYDVIGIQEFVTANGRPIALEGASDLLKRFDQAQREQPGSIFAGGGRGVELAASESAARARVAALKADFRQATVCAVLAAAAVPLRDERAGLQWLRLELEADKERADAPGGKMPETRETECEGCRIYAIEFEFTHPAQDGEEARVERLCERCYRVIRAARRERRRQGEPPRTLNDVARRGMIGVVSADGNNMGQFFEQLDTLERLAGASLAVARIFEDAHEAACKSLWFPFIDPVTGGDDLRILLDPAELRAYVEPLVHGVEAGAARAGDLDGLLDPEQASLLQGIGVGIGAVVANHHFPVSRLFDYAHQLEDSAKSLCRLRPEGAGWRKPARSALDFTVMTSADFSLISPRPLTRRPGQRPFDVGQDPWLTLLAQAEALAALPNAQQAVLAEEARLERAEFFNLLRYQVARSRKWQEYYRLCGVDWTDPQAVERACPEQGLLELVRLLRLESSPRPRPEGERSAR